MVTVFVPGVFDVFHVGHLSYLKRASEAGDYLVVGVQDDREVRRLKHVDPVIPLMERMTIIEHLRFVDEVISYVDVFQGPLLTGLEVDVLAVGEEYGSTDQYPDQKRTLQFCEENGIRVHRIPRTREISSTIIRKRLQSFWNSRSEHVKDLPAGVTVLGSHQGDQRLIVEQTSREVALVADQVVSPEDKVLLDLGCGDGRQLVDLARSFRKVIGVDFAESLLKLARRRLDEAGLSGELIVSDAIEYEPDQPIDVFLLSGLLPCIDDDQAARVADKLRRHAQAGRQLFVRTSVGLERRIDVVNQYSTELKSRYTAYYRTDEEIIGLFAKNGWQLESSEMLYQHRADSGVKWYQFSGIADEQMRRFAA
jgi:glycerol-3-phosphate cytidylyltransferase